MKEIKTDLHNHLASFSYKGNFNKVVDITKKKLGKGGILGITNYNDFRYENFMRLRKGYKIQNIGNAFYIPEKEILVVKGQEVLTKQGHVLVLGLKEDFNLQNKRTLEDSLKQAKDNNGITIAVHPFFIWGIGNYLRKNSKLLKYFDGFEVHDGEAFYGNKNAEIFYNLIKDDYDIGALSFSDGHSLYEIGSSYTLLEQPDFRNSERLIESLRKSIKQHEDYSKDRQHFSKLGSLDHSMDTIGMIALMKLGKKLRHLK